MRTLKELGRAIADADAEANEHLGEMIRLMAACDRGAVTLCRHCDFECECHRHFKKYRISRQKRGQAIAGLLTLARREMLKGG